MTIRPSIRLSALPKSLPFEARFRMARDAGFEGIEVEVGDGPAAALRSAADAAGLEIHSVHCWENYWKPLSSPDPAVRDAGIAATVATLEAARIVGADSILLVPGVVGSDATYGEVYERSSAVIRSDILPEAERRGLSIAIENVWNGFLLGPYDCVRYIEGFGTPDVRLYLDVGNIVFGRPEGWIDIAGHCIAKLHLKDLIHWQHRRSYKIGPIGAGEIDWGRLRAALARAGFSGWAVTAEAETCQPFWPHWSFITARRGVERGWLRPVAGLAERAICSWIVRDSMRRFRRYVAPARESAG